eukprot:3085035-Pleurochrysis_carterae.AAC.1
MEIIARHSLLGIEVAKAKKVALLRSRVDDDERRLAKAAKRRKRRKDCESPSLIPSDGQVGFTHTESNA